MVHFVGAGPGAPDLITQRGAALLRAADVVIYAGSLVNPALLGLCRQDCSVYNSAQMTLEQVLEVVRAAHAENRDIVRACTRETRAFTAPSGSRWTHWTHWAFPMTIPPAFPASAARRPRPVRNTLCRA